VKETGKHLTALKSACNRVFSAVMNVPNSPYLRF